MKNNNKGFTIVELIVSFAIAIPILIGLYKIVDAYREKQLKNEYEKEIISYKNDIINAVQTDINTHGLKEMKFIDECDPQTSDNLLYGIEIVLKDNSKNKLCVYNLKEEDKFDYIFYNNIKYEVPNKFISFVNDLVYDRNKYDNVKINSYLKSNETYYTIDIKMKHSELSKNFIISMVFPTRTNLVSGGGVEVANASIDKLNSIKNGNTESGIIEIENEKFKIMKSNNNKVFALAEENIYVGKKLNGDKIKTTDSGFGLQSNVKSTTDFYHNECGFSLPAASLTTVNVSYAKLLVEGEVFPKPEEPYAEYIKVYRGKEDTDIWDYLEYYENYLNINETDYNGHTYHYNITVRLPVATELSDNNGQPFTVYPELRNTYYWVGTAFKKGMYAVTDISQYLVAHDCNKSDKFGIRPMIEIDLN